MPDDAAAPVAVVHIGLHKTGTTAFQETLDRAAGPLLAHDVRVMLYAGPAFPGTPRSTSYDLLNAVIRTDCDAWFRLMEPESLLTSVQAACADSVRQQAAAPQRLLIASHEGLSLVRTPAEVRRLVELLHPRQVRIVVVLRDLDDYVDSLRRQVLRFGLPVTNRSPDSCLNISKDSWLADFHGLVEVYASVVGRENVSVLDYDELVRHDGTVVPALWTACGLPDVEGLDELVGWGWTNQSPVVSERDRALRADLEATENLGQLRDIAHQARRELLTMRESLSWRITAPLRRAKQLAVVIKRRWLARDVAEPTA